MNKRRILVIEDDQDVRETVKFLLDLKGFRVYTSSTGADVFTIVDKIKPHLIITDIFLGKLDGRVICRSIKSNPKTSNIPVIIMSSASDIYNTIHDVGANDVVLKPFDENTLLNRIQRQLSA
jgi:DNA-binding response OmpR family regulator